MGERERTSLEKAKQDMERRSLENAAVAMLAQPMNWQWNQTPGMATITTSNAPASTSYNAAQVWSQNK
jgi:hypothetical protein